MKKKIERREQNWKVSLKTKDYTEPERIELKTSEII